MNELNGLVVDWNSCQVNWGDSILGSYEREFHSSWTILSWSTIISIIHHCLWKITAVWTRWQSLFVFISNIFDEIMKHFFLNVLGTEKSTKVVGSQSHSMCSNAFTSLWFVQWTRTQRTSALTVCGCPWNNQITNKRSSRYLLFSSLFLWIWLLQINSSIFFDTHLEFVAFLLFLRNGQIQNWLKWKKRKPIYTSNLMNLQTLKSSSRKFWNWEKNIFKTQNPYPLKRNWLYIHIHSHSTRFHYLFLWI